MDLGVSMEDARAMSDGFLRDAVEAERMVEERRQASGRSDEVPTDEEMDQIVKVLLYASKAQFFFLPCIMGEHINSFGGLGPTTIGSFCMKKKKTKKKKNAILKGVYCRMQEKKS